MTGVSELWQHGLGELFRRHRLCLFWVGAGYFNHTDYVKDVIDDNSKSVMMTITWAVTILWIIAARNIGIYNFVCGYRYSVEVWQLCCGYDKFVCYNIYPAGVILIVLTPVITQTYRSLHTVLIIWKRLFSIHIWATNDCFVTTNSELIGLSWYSDCVQVLSPGDNDRTRIDCTSFCITPNYLNNAYG